MKVIVAGSRGITDLAAVSAAIKLSGYEVTEIVSGGARGVDRLGEVYASIHRIPVKKFPVTDAEWKQDRGAGLRRNERMADYAEALILVWDGESRGSRHMRQAAWARGLLVFVHLVQDSTQDGTTPQ